jgi:hypothetical protein
MSVSFVTNCGRTVYQADCRAVASSSFASDQAFASAALTAVASL